MERNGVQLEDVNDVPALRIAIAEARMSQLLELIKSQQEQIRMLCGVIMGLDELDPPEAA